MRQVERQRDAGHAIRREPFFREPEMRQEADAARPQLAMQPAHVIGHTAADARQRQVAERKPQQLFVRHAREHARCWRCRAAFCLSFLRHRVMTIPKAAAGTASWHPVNAA